MTKPTIYQYSFYRFFEENLTWSMDEDNLKIVIYRTLLHNCEEEYMDQIEGLLLFHKNILELASIGEQIGTQDIAMKYWKILHL